jgi:16S rRNA processing protein RimM
MNSNLICIAKITKPHGIRGQAKLISYADTPYDIFEYECLYDQDLNKYKIHCESKLNDSFFIVRVNNINSRNEIEEIAGINLYITKDMLSLTKEDEYYYEDLIGLQVFDSDNILQGHVVAVHNFGAGDLIEISIKNTSMFLPFNKDFVIKVDLISKSIIFDFQAIGPL